MTRPTQEFPAVIGIVLIAGLLVVAGAVLVIRVEPASAQATQPGQPLVSMTLLRDIDRALWACSVADGSNGWPARAPIIVPTAGIRQACKDLEAALVQNPDALLAFQAEELRLIGATTKRLNQ